MIIHVLGNIPQKARGNDTHAPKRNTRKIHILVALRIRQLARLHHHLIGHLAARNARNHLQVLQQTRASDFDGFGDVGEVVDPEVEQHSTADVFFGVGDEFADKDVVVGCVPNDTADDANSEGEGRDGGDQIVGTDDCADDGGGDDDAADAKAGEDEEAEDCVQVVDARDGEGATAYRDSSVCLCTL